MKRSAPSAQVASWMQLMLEFEESANLLHSPLRSLSRAWDIYEGGDNSAIRLRRVAHLYRGVLVTGLDAWIAKREVRNVEERFDELLSALQTTGAAFIFSSCTSQDNIHPSKRKILRKLLNASRRVYEVTCGITRRLK
ncbi:MAG: hypothetical protein ACTS40_01840 [Candidatus Hodgkinia cicadicola]